jgi:hypothetical protein
MAQARNVRQSLLAEKEQGRDPAIQREGSVVAFASSKTGCQPNNGQLILKKQLFQALSRIGAILTVTGSAGLLLGFLGVIDFSDFAFGISAGIRILGSVAIGGCLLSAIGCFGLESGGSDQT